MKTLRLLAVLHRSPSAFPFGITGVIDENKPSNVGRDDGVEGDTPEVGGYGSRNNGPPSSPLPEPCSEHPNGALVSPVPTQNFRGMSKSKNVW